MFKISALQILARDLSLDSGQDTPKQVQFLDRRRCPVINPTEPPLNRLLMFGGMQESYSPKHALKVVMIGRHGVCAGRPLLGRVNDRL